MLGFKVYITTAWWFLETGAEEQGESVGGLSDPGSELSLSLLPIGAICKALTKNQERRHSARPNPMRIHTYWKEDRQGHGAGKGG